MLGRNVIKNYVPFEYIPISVTFPILFPKKGIAALLKCNLFFTVKSIILFKVLKEFTKFYAKQTKIPKRFC